MVEKLYKCVCGFKTTNKGGYIEHINGNERTHGCEKYARSNPLTRKISRMVDQSEEDKEDEDIGLGHTTRKSACCNSPMRMNHRIGVMVCSKCGKSPWENQGMPRNEKRRRGML